MSVTISNNELLVALMYSECYVVVRIDFSYYVSILILKILFIFFFFQAEDGIRDFCLSRGLGDVYKRQDY